MGGVCTNSEKEKELNLQPTIEKTGRMKIDLEDEFLLAIQNINFPNALVKVLRTPPLAKTQISRTIHFRDTFDASPFEHSEE